MNHPLDWFDEWELWRARVVSRDGATIAAVIVVAASFTWGTIGAMHSGLGLSLAWITGVFMAIAGVFAALIAFAVFLPIMPLVFAIIAAVLTLCARALRKRASPPPPATPPIPLP